MSKKKIISKLHKFLFPSISKELATITFSHENAKVYVAMLTNEKAELNEKLIASQTELKQLKEKPVSSLADLMRDSLKLVTIDFSNIQEDGLPKHFLDTDVNGKREQYINELYQIAQFEVWETMCKNHIDTQGNKSVRTAANFDEMLAARFSINGIGLLRHEVKKGFEEYQERSKPPEDFDKYETNEGIIINNNNEEDK